MKTDDEVAASVKAALEAGIRTGKREERARVVALRNRVFSGKKVGNAVAFQKLLSEFDRLLLAVKDEDP